MRVWSKMVDEGLHEGITEISFSAMFRERMRNMPVELREARFRNIGDPRRHDRFKSTYELGAQSPFVLYAVAAYERAFETLEGELAENGPWVLGDEATLADIALMPYVARLDFLGLLEVWTETRPNIKAWWVQAQEWPSFKRGLRERVSEDEFAEMQTHGSRIRAEVAELVAGLRRVGPVLER
jgi:glutathione S-transferase